MPSLVVETSSSKASHSQRLMRCLTPASWTPLVSKMPTLWRVTPCKMSHTWTKSLSTRTRLRSRLIQRHGNLDPELRQPLLLLSPLQSSIFQHHPIVEQLPTGLKRNQSPKRLRDYLFRLSYRRRKNLGGTAISRSNPSTWMLYLASSIT